MAAFLQRDIIVTNLSDRGYPFKYVSDSTSLFEIKLIILDRVWFNDFFSFFLPLFGRGFFIMRFVDK